MKKTLLFLMLFFGMAQSEASPRFAGIFGDNMVLQQQSHVRLWGYGDAEQSVEIEVSWSPRRYTAVVKADGQWNITIPTPKASYAPQQITLIGENTRPIRLDNILIGEVWLCSGQSNMEMVMRPDSTWRLFVERAEEEIARANCPHIRHITIARKESFEPTEDLADGRWQACTPQSVRWLSAAGYYFARQLQAELDVPVGLIVDSYGGSPLQSWLPETTIDDPFYNRERTRRDQCRESGATKPEYDMASALYNGMLRPVIGYTLRGFLWYQGCSNVSDAARYPKMMGDLVESWRGAWNNCQLPFYFVQIAPFVYPDHQLGRWAELAWAQTLAAEAIPRSGMVITADIGDPQNIHPGKKRPVGERLARLALSDTYGRPTDARSPEVRRIHRSGMKLLIDLQHAGPELHATNDDSEFEVSQDGVLFSRADFKLDGRQIELQAPFEGVRYVRYCWRDNARSNIFNAEQLPLGPFFTEIHEAE